MIVWRGVEFGRHGPSPSDSGPIVVGLGLDKKELNGLGASILSPIVQWPGSGFQALSP